MDMEYLLALQQVRESLPDWVMYAATGFSDLMSGPFVVLAVAVLFWCVDKRLGYFLATAFCLGSVVNQLIKNLACVYRPWILDSRIEVAAPAATHATGYSFPSGHTTMAVGFYGGLAVWFRKHRLFVALMVALLLLTGFSRNFLGCHTPQDVLVALVVSGFTLLCIWKLFSYIQKHPEKDIVIASLGFVAAGAMLAFIAFKGYLMDYNAAGQLLVDSWEMQTDCFKAAGAFMGLCLAWIVERRFIKFDTQGSVGVRVVRGMVGCVILGAFYLGIMPWAFAGLDGHVAAYLDNFLLILLAVAGYPAVVKWAQDRRSA